MAAKASPCHNARISMMRADGVSVGSCDTCHEQVVRINPRTGAEEWLGTFDANGAWTGGISPWTQRDDLLRVQD